MLQARASFFLFFLLLVLSPSLGHITGTFDDQIDERVYEMFLQHPLFVGSYANLMTSVNSFLSSLQTLANTNGIPLSINLASPLGEEILMGVIYDTAPEPTGKLAMQNIELAYDAYTSSYRNRAYLVSLMFSNIDPMLAFKPATTAQAPHMLEQDFEFQMYPTQDTYVYENNVQFSTAGFAPMTLNDFTPYFTPYTLSLIDIPLSTPLIHAGLEYERLFWRSGTLGNTNITICVEFVYPSSTDLQGNTKTVEIEFMMEIDSRPAIPTSVYQNAQNLHKLMAANASWNAQYVKGRFHVRLVWVFVAAIVALILGGIACFIIYRRAKRSEGARLFENESS